MSNYGLSDDEKRAISSDTNFFGNLAVRWVAIVVGAGVIMSLVYAFWVRPAMLDAERKQNTHSQQYVESQRTFLVQKWTACTTLEADIKQLEAQNDPSNDALIQGKKTQLTAFINEMKQRISLIPADAVPPEIKTYLTQH